MVLLENIEERRLIHSVAKRQLSSTLKLHYKTCDSQLHSKPNETCVVIFFSLTEAPLPDPTNTPKRTRNGPKTDPKRSQTEPKRSQMEPKRTEIKLFGVGRAGGFVGEKLRRTQEGCGGLGGENPAAFPQASPIFQQPFSLPESAQTLAGMAFRAAGKPGNHFPAASKFAGKPFQQRISDSP